MKIAHRLRVSMEALALMASTITPASAPMPILDQIARASDHRVTNPLAKMEDLVPTQTMAATFAIARRVGQEPTVNNWSIGVENHLVKMELDASKEEHLTIVNVKLDGPAKFAMCNKCLAKLLPCSEA